MKTKVAFIMALMVTLFTAVIYVGARSVGSDAPDTIANIVVAEDTQININLTESDNSLAAPQTQVDPKNGLDTGFVIEAEPVAVNSIDTVNSREVAVYIIQLADAPVASYDGSIDGYAATSPSALGNSKMSDTSAADMQAYAGYLKEEQAAFTTSMESTLRRPVETTYTYQHAFNGMAVEMTGIEAQEVRAMDGVAFVTREVIEQLLTDVGPAWIGAPGIWDGTTTGVATQGEGIVVAILDSGINSAHPSFAATGQDGYTHINPLGSGTYIAGSHCDATPAFCNDKLIGAWDMVNDAVGDPNSPEDSDGHGSHTAGTTAGNVVTSTLFAPTAAITQTISGVAPHANIIAYDVCVDSCPGAALLAAMDQVILDSAALPNGIAVINYSISGGGDPYNDPIELAFLAATDAGIYVSASAGNSGPDASTVAHLGPWVGTTAASTHNRKLAEELTGLTSDGSSLADILGQGFTAGYGPAPIVYAGDYPATTGSTPELCGAGNAGSNTSPWPPGTFNGEIVVCDRGTYGRVEKGDNVLAAGAGGYVLANTDADGESVLAASYALPGMHIGETDGDILRAWLADSANTNAMASISGTSENYDATNGDIMAGFSSRGPADGLSVLKPDITAPGVGIWAAVADDGNAGADYAFYSGTSMSSPHHAGAVALMTALHPTWTPAQIKSALMTTAYNGNTLFKEDGVTPVDPFDLGSGRIALTNAANAGFVLDETLANFEAADPVLGGDLATLNIANFHNGSCLAGCSWVRTLSSTQSSPVEWFASMESTPTMTISVDPASFTLDASGTQEITVTVTLSDSAEVGEWLFGSVMLTSTVSPDAHFPVVVMPSNGVLPEIVAINTRRDAGSQLVSDLETVAAPTMTLRSFGLALPIAHTFTLTQADVAPDFPDIFFQPATEFTEVMVPVGGQRFLAEIVDTTSPDLDMIVFHDANDNGVPELDDVDMNNPNATCQSASGGSYEKCDIMNPVDGRWFVAVFNYETSANPPDSVELHTAVVSSDAGNMTITGPASVEEATPFDLHVFWNEPAMMAGETWYGAFDMGTDPANPGNIGTIPVNVTRYADDVTKTADRTEAPVDGLVEYTIEIQPNFSGEDMVYTITDTIPAGMTYVPGSVTGGAVVTGNTLTWSDTMIGTYQYNMTTSDNDPLCDTPFGGYVNLEAFGILAQSGISGDTDAWTAFSTGAPFSYYGVDYAGIGFTDDGFAIFDAANNYGGAPWTAQTLPDSAYPNNVIAALWQDMEIFYDGPSNSGVSLATAGPNIAIVEYDNMQFWGGSADTWDFEVVALRQPVDAPGNYEYVIAYDNLNGDLSGPLTVGIENAAGDQALALVNNGDASGTLSDGFMVCYDWAGPTSSHVITYWAQVDSGVASGTILTNTVSHEVDNIGSEVVDVDFAVEVVDVAYGVDLSGDDAGKAMPGETVSYMVTITNTGNVTDTYDIVTIGTWDAPIAPITLLWGETETFMVDVNIPSNALNGSSATSIVVATSQGDTAESDTTTLTTTVEVFYVFLPTIMK